MRLILQLLGSLGWCVMFSAAKLSAAESNTLEQWDMFEVSLKGAADGNPFTDVTLSARFTQGDHAVTATGFYDGEGNYKIRFMPESAGEWRYTTASNRPELAEKTGVLTVAPPGSANHGPVRVAHTFHFAYADGTPFREIGTTCYAWAQQTDAQEEQTLQSLASAPFNKIRMCVLPPGRASRVLRFYPFVGTPPRSWDTTRFAPAFFRHLEERIGQLRDLGIEADLILFHPYDQTWGFNSMDAAGDDRYVRYLVARLSAFRNVWWSLANEFDLVREKRESDWDRLFQLVQSGDPYGHLRSIHNSVLIYNNAQPWVTHASIQNGAAVLDPERAEFYRDVWRKPVVYDEVKYEGTSTARWGQLKAEELVERFWNGTVAGTYVGHGEAYRGNATVWTSAGGVLYGESSARLAFLRKILAESPPEGIEPIDKWQERRMGGKAGEFYLVYFGEQAPASWPFLLYKTGLADGMKFTVEVIDTWDMTITPIEGVFVIKARDAYVFADKDNREVALPARPYLALRIRRQH